MIQLEFSFLDEIPTNPAPAPAPVAEIQEPETLPWDFPTEYADPVHPWTWTGKPEDIEKFFRRQECSLHAPAFTEGAPIVAPVKYAVPRKGKTFPLILGKFTPTDDWDTSVWTLKLFHTVQDMYDYWESYRKKAESRNYSWGSPVCFDIWTHRLAEPQDNPRRSVSQQEFCLYI